MKDGRKPRFAAMNCRVIDTVAMLTDSRVDILRMAVRRRRCAYGGFWQKGQNSQNQQYPEWTVSRRLRVLRPIQSIESTN